MIRGARDTDIERRSFLYFLFLVFLMFVLYDNDENWAMSPPQSSYGDIQMMTTATTLTLMKRLEMRDASALVCFLFYFFIFLKSYYLLRFHMASATTATSKRDDGHHHH